MFETIMAVLVAYGPIILMVTGAIACVIGGFILLARAAGKQASIGAKAAVARP
jgi:hypothetical protein